MLAELKFVQGAVAKKDFLPALTHFAIKGGRVRGYNGTLALSCPIPIDIDCRPKAAPLVQAIGNCSETVALALTPAGRLNIRSGSFRAFVDCSEEEPLDVQPEGTLFECNGEALVQGLKVVGDFVGDDASRPWCTGALFRGPSIYATNNVCLVEFWTGIDFPVSVNIPRAAIKEILRVGEAPTHLQVSEASCTFHYADERWIRSQLLPSDWPDLTRILDAQSEQVALPDLLFPALESVRPFVDKLGRVFFRDGSLHTTETDGEGASYDVPGIASDGVYNIEMLRLLKDIASSIDFAAYPKPCIFYGDRLRGALVGMRHAS